MNYNSPKRLRPFREPTLIVIATEDSKSDPKYFEDLAMAYRVSNIKVEVIRRDNTNSSPKYVLNSLDKYNKKFDLKKNDELWLVCDVDRWRSELGDVVRECIQKKYFYAISNPCSDLWYLLHLKSLKNYSKQRKKDLFENRKSGSRHYIEKEIINLGYSFNKSNLDTSQFLPHIKKAINEAKRLDRIRGRKRWPQSLGTMIYLLVQKIVK